MDVSLGASQLDLFAAADPAIDPSFSTARRLELDATSWIEHVPGWLTGSEHLLAAMAELAPWEQRDRWMIDRRVTEPRLTAEYPDLTELPIPLVHEVAGALSDHYGVPYDGLWCNLYRDERDSTSWHGDRVGVLGRACIVPVLSLGATRRFLVKPRTGGTSHVFRPAGGDLIVMGGRCQVDWRHSVPKQTTPAGARVSINFQSTAQRGRR
jgi:alkylated DNA repair dioxygenase AlkB